MTSLGVLRMRCRCPIATKGTAFGPVRHSRRSRRYPFIAASIDLNGLELDIPEIDGDAKSYQLEMGASLNDAGIVTTFGQREKVLAAVSGGVALADRSHWGRLRVGGPGSVALLQRVAAPNSGLGTWGPGRGGDVELLSGSGSLGQSLVLVQETGVMLVVPPARSTRVFDRLDTASTIEDQVTIRDISRQCSMFSLVGPGSAEILRQLGAGGIVDEPYGSHTVLKMKSKPVLVAVGSGLKEAGYTIIADESIGGDLYAALAGQDCALMGEEEWELLTVTLVPEAEEVTPAEVATASAASSTPGSGEADSSTPSAEPPIKAADHPKEDDEPHSSQPAPEEQKQPSTSTSTATTLGASVTSPVPQDAAKGTYTDTSPQLQAVSSREDHKGKQDDRDTEEDQQEDKGGSLTADYSAGDDASSYGDDCSSGGDGGVDLEGGASADDEEGTPVNKWRLIVDRAMLPTRKARIVDIEQVQQHGNPAMRL